MYKLDLLLKEQQIMSSQCLTLGSRYKNICKLCNRQQILGAYAEIMPMMKIRWIPVSSTGMTGIGTGMTPILLEITLILQLLCSKHWNDIMIGLL
ncbi:hypothetical protein [Wolbachia endosymbiont of Aedes albopictus]|uniref:hypothetical protein n=1 Tax=Wolbachia endosymbiont of Aedes albopictus TaxID=167957 RepID=UPI000BBC8005|nr:hypothetical protein [Wolbachia endosymbiont of Aedes albopictus]TVS98708.1 hypothetical protein COM42_001080 [Wolbachia pipientis]UVW83526.1 hypothetical protein NHG98_04045 [Wolbachia endosymbiont of Aedes albopictus]